VNTTARSETVWVRRLKDARQAAGLSQRQLGVAAGLDEGVASTRINRYELGVHRPDYGIAVQLARALNVPVAYLYCDDDVTAQILLALHRVTVQVRRQVLDQLQAGAHN
jgi:transcriptional regulator with XRE-family HTH domain